MIIKIILINNKICIYYIILYCIILYCIVLYYVKGITVAAPLVGNVNSSFSLPSAYGSRRITASLRVTKKAR